MNRFNMKLSLLGLATISVCALASPAMAQSTVYTSQAAFTAATTGVTDTNFDGIATAPTYFVAEGTSFSIGSDSFSTTGSGNFLNVTDPAYYGAMPQFNTPNLGVFNGTSNSVAAPISYDLTIDFAPTTAVGIDVASLFDAGVSDIVLSDGTTVNSFVTPDGTLGYAFLGFTSTSPLTSLTITDSSGLNQGLLLEDVQTGSYAPAPEVSSLAALVSLMGLCGATLLLRKRKQQIS